MVLALVILFTIVNLFTMLMFWRDKRRAMAGERRIPEADLLARHLFRHKTRKQPFSIQLQLIAIIQVGALAGFLLF